MSSDSDSDVCDFTSDISKQMSRGNNQFWQQFNKVVENYTPVDQAHVTDKENVEVSCTSKLHIKPISNVYAKKISAKESTSNTYTESQNVNVQNRIVNKLGKLSEEIDSILQNKRGKLRRNKRKPVKKPQRNPRRSNNRVLNLSLSDSDAFVSDDEINNVIAALINTEEEKEEEEELNPIVTVNILWKFAKKNSFKVHKYQPLNCIIEHYSKEYDVKPELLFFTLDEKYVKLEENSFVSLRLNDAKQIEGGILPESCLETSQQCMNTTTTENEIEFKARHRERKCEINVGCKKGDKMEIIFWQICKHFKEPVENIKIYFRSYVVKPSTNISDLNLDRNACLDIYVLNNLK